MSKTTEVSGKGIRDGSIQKRDIDITTTGESLVTRLVAGTGISISSTGADSGTGEVTITSTSAQYQGNNTWLGWRSSSDLFYLENLKVDSSDDLIINAEKYVDDPGTPGPDLSTSNIFFQINKQNALSITSDSTLKVFPTNFLLHGNTPDGSDNQSITITPANTTSNFATRGASIRLFGNEHDLTPGGLIIETGTRTNSSLVLNSSTANGKIQLKVASNDVLTISTFLIEAKQNVTIPAGNSNNLPLSFTGDTNTGLFSPSQNRITIVADGQRILEVDPQSRVGINEETPLAQLHVKQIGSTTGILVKGGNGTFLQAQDGAGNVKFEVASNGTITVGKIAAENILNLSPVAASSDYNDLINKPNLILQSEKGVANGVATLNESGQVPASQLPSYVDDVLEFATLSSFPLTGEIEKVYVAKDTSKIYRWSGSIYIEINPGIGTSDTANKLATSRTISATGDASWSVNFDGSTNASGVLTLSNSGVVAGTYTKVEVDAKGRATLGTSLDENDIPVLDASKIITGIFDSSRIPTSISITGNAATATKLATSRTISATGDASWSVNFDGSTNASNTITLSNTGVSPGTYTKITVDTKGRATSGTTLTQSDIPSLDASKITTGTISTDRLPAESLVPTGTVVAFAGSAAPAGWLICNGATVSTTTYSILYSIIGTLYNGGAVPAGTFKVPDLRRRVPIGKSSLDTALGNSDLLAEADRRLSHVHSITVKGHYHGMGAGATAAVDISHSHGASAVTITSDGGHNHSISITSQGVSANHTHRFVDINTFTPWVKVGGTSPGTGWGSGYNIYYKPSDSNKTINIQGTESAGHTHLVSGNTTDGAGAHAHAGSTAAGQSLGTTNRSITGNIGLVTNGQNGNVDNTYDSTEKPNVNYVIMNYIIKT